MRARKVKTTSEEGDLTGVGELFKEDDPAPVQEPKKEDNPEPVPRPEPPNPVNPPVVSDSGEGKQCKKKRDCGDKFCLQPPEGGPNTCVPKQVYIDNMRARKVKTTSEEGDLTGVGELFKEDDPAPVPEPESPGDPAAGSNGDPAAGSNGDPAAGSNGDPAGSGSNGDPAAGSNGDPAAGSNGDPAAGSMAILLLVLMVILLLVLMALEKQKLILLIYQQDTMNSLKVKLDQKHPD